MHIAPSKVRKAKGDVLGQYTTDNETTRQQIARETMTNSRPGEHMLNMDEIERGPQMPDREFLGKATIGEGHGTMAA
jgi:hypothetical protein